MKKLTMYGGALAFALFLGLAGIVARDAHPTTVAYAQSGTTATATADTTVVQTTQPVRTSSGFPYGLLGLLGLAGLAGLRRPAAPAQSMSAPGEAKVYNTRK